MEINSLYFRIASGTGENINNPLIASNENEMNNYLNDSKYNGKFVQYIGPDGIYKNNGIYKIENKSAILYTDTTDGTASSNDILLNKIAYSNGEKLIGTIESETIPEVNQNTTLNTANKYITDNIIINIENKNPYIASSDEEMESYLQDIKYLGSFVKFTGISELYVTNEIYRVATTGNPTQYEPVGSTLSLKDILNIRNGQYLFYKCITLTDDQLNSIIKYDDTENVTSMDYMFAKCTSLTTIPLLNTSKVDHIDYMFSNCENLITIPFLEVDINKLLFMSGMFSGCYKLSKIDIRKLAYNNSQFAYNCHSLKTLIIRNMDTIIPLQSNSFSNCYHFYGTVNATYNPDGLKDGRIYVPDDKVESLKAATNWSVFADIIVPLSTYVEEV